MHGLSFMTNKRHLHVLNLGRLLRDRYPVDGQLPLCIQLALCHLIRAEQEAIQNDLPPNFREN
jgi:hypothetical protein